MENYLFKFFDDPKYIEEFRNGKIRLMSAFHYANIEHSAPLYNNRFDLTEGESFIFHNNTPEDEKTIHFGNGTTMKLGIGVQSLVANSGTPNEQIKLSCYYAIEREDIPDGKLQTALDAMQGDLGDYYIFFHDPEAFAHRVQKSLNRAEEEGKVVDFALKKVRYYDVEHFNGFSLPFDKPDGLSWQKEYRLAVNTVGQPDPFYVDVNNLKDITIWGKKSDLERGFVVDESTIFIPNHYQ